jgi:glucosamine--fructose-6-phosphate aminotransferase (isomerizing)
VDFSKIDLRWENMLAGIRAQVPFLREAPSAIYANITEIVRLDRPPARVYLTGCGDSWYCGMATRHAFEAWAGLPTEAVQALEFSRYLVRYAPHNSLAIAVSNSGRVSRTIEAAAQARLHGLYAVGCTSNLTEGLSQEVDATIDLAYAERRFAPGTSSYMASMVVQYCLALYLAELSGRMDARQVQAMLAEMSGLAEGMQRTIEDNESLYEQLGTTARLDHQIAFIGGGPNHGTALFSMAKIIEAARISAIGQELEEWAHEQYFVTGTDTLTFVLAPPDASVDRAREQMVAIRAMGSTCIAICDPGDHETQAEADTVIPVYGQPGALLTPLVYCVPAEMFAFFFAATKDLKMLGFDNEHVKQVNFRQIFQSRIKRDRD